MSPRRMVGGCFRASRMAARVRSSRPVSGQMHASIQRVSPSSVRSMGDWSRPNRAVIAGSRGAIGGVPPSTVHSMRTSDSAGPVAPAAP